MALNRRDVLKTGAFAAASLAIPLERAMAGSPSKANRMPTSKLPQPFTVPFVVPPVAKPVRTDATTDYYRIRMQQVFGTILPGYKTPLFAYNGTVPGPTIKVRQGRQVKVRHINQLPTAHPTLKYTPWTSVHLHGSASLPQYDGYASDISMPGQYKDYIYPDVQPARTLWYHDHGVHHTAENVYQGLFAQYHLSDAREDALKLPTGEFDVPLMIGDAMFNQDGSLLFSLDDHKGLWGDVILVNGRPWPVMKVKRRKYRFRVLVGSISRSYEWSLGGEPFTVIGTDGGLLPTAQTVTSIRHASAERYEIVVDFSKYPVGKRIVMSNKSPKQNTDFVNTDKIMAFDVVGDPFDNTNNGPVPTQLDPGNPIMALKASDAKRTRRLELERKGGEWVINGTTWAKIEASNFQFVEAAPNHGDVEIWELVNKGGGWFHPLHIHLVDFKILDRNGKPPFPFELGPKDVTYLGPNETVRAIMKFEGAGRYMVHCHNLVHEDHDMMTQFRVVNPASDPDPMGTPAVTLPERTPL